MTSVTNPRTKVLLDTDIGDDIDDGLCLAYLLARQDCDLVGITTVSGSGRERAMLASAFCTAAGRDTPIYIGAQQSLAGLAMQPHAVQAPALEGLEHRDEFPSDHAVDFMRETIRSSPGEIVLISIGPMTNAALLFAVDPTIPELLKQFVTMGGAFTAQTSPGYEWNVLCDVHAAAAAFSAAPAGRHVAVGLDVTAALTIPVPELAAALEGVPSPLMACATPWIAYTHRTDVTFHDPLAAAVAFDPTLCSFETGDVEVVLDGPERGATRYRPTAEGRQHIATEVDRDSFFRHYFGTVSPQGRNS